MFNRRFLRVKVFKTVFSYAGQEQISLKAAQNELDASFLKSLDLYYYLLRLPLAVREFARERIRSGLKKYQPSPEELNPNRRFADNRVLDILEADEKAGTYASQRGLSWAPHAAYVKKLYQRLTETDFFRAYMDNEHEPDFLDDRRLVCRFMEFAMNDPELDDILEDESLFWVDDAAYVCNVFLEYLCALKSPQSVMEHPRMFRNEDDKAFAHTLLSQSLLHYDEYAQRIVKVIKNWELERIAQTDVVLIVMGVAEVLSFDNIPVKVSLNEMVEITKAYSTPNSRAFVNGVLDKVIASLKEEGLVHKTGRGLIEQ